MFKYCPNCGSVGVRFDGLKLYECGKCGWSFYHNACAAVMAVLSRGEKILFTIRAGEPAIDKLDLPGGFVDPGETADEAIRREISEEIGLRNCDLAYLGSAVNSYKYNNIIYHTCDIIYHAEITELPVEFQESEIRGILMLDLKDINGDDIAFPSVKKALELWTNMKI